MFHFEDAHKGARGAPMTGRPQQHSRPEPGRGCGAGPALTLSDCCFRKVPEAVSRRQAAGGGEGAQVNRGFSEGQFQCKEQVTQLQHYLGSDSPTKPTLRQRHTGRVAAASSSEWSPQVLELNPPGGSEEPTLHAQLRGTPPPG